MKKYFFKRNKYLIASTGLFLGTLTTNSPFFQMLGGSCMLYNYFERLGLIDGDFNPEIVHRKIALSEYILFRLLRDHLLKTESLNRWMTSNTLMLAKPLTYFEDQGLIGLVNTKFGLGLFGKQEFIMNVHWKDLKFNGEGVAYCTGKFSDMNNYFLTSIYVDLINPRKEFFVILEDNTIDVS